MQSIFKSKFVYAVLSISTEVLIQIQAFYFHLQLSIHFPFPSSCSASPVSLYVTILRWRHKHFVMLSFRFPVSDSMYMHSIYFLTVMVTKGTERDRNCNKKCHTTVFDSILDTRHCFLRILAYTKGSKQTSSSDVVCRDAILDMTGSRNFFATASKQLKIRCLCPIQSLKTLRLESFCETVRHYSDSDTDVIWLSSYI